MAGLTDAVTRDRITQWIAGLTPPYTGYDLLRRALTNYRQIAAQGGWKALAAGEIGPKATEARIAALRARLSLEDRDTPASGTGYDGPLREAVVRAQKRYGLNPTGIVGAQTLTALNVPVADRVGCGFGADGLTRGASHGLWRSLVAHLTGGQGVAGSNPVSPTV